MSDATWKIQISPKLPDGTLVNLRADSASEMDSLLRYVETKAQDITAFAALLTGAANAASGGLTAPSPQASNGWSGAAAQAGPGPTCAHGAMTFRTGTSAKGAWKGYFCPTPKGTPGQCEPQFQR